MATDTAAPPAVESPPARPRSKLVLIVACLAIVVTAQVVITWLLMPKGTAAPAATSSQDTKPPEEAPAEDSGSSEVPLGDFQCTNTTNPGTNVQVSFKMTALITSSKANWLGTRVNDTHKSRLGQSVAKVVRGAKLDDLNEASHSTLRRLLKDEINRLLRTDIEDIVLTDFRQMDQ